MLAVTRDEDVDAEFGLLTAAGRRSKVTMEDLGGGETATTQEHRNIRHVLVLRVLV